MFTVGLCFYIALVTCGQLYHDLSQTEFLFYPNLSQLIPRGRAARWSEETALPIGGALAHQEECVHLQTGQMDKMEYTFL